MGKLKEIRFVYAGSGISISEEGDNDFTAHISKTRKISIKQAKLPQRSFSDYEIQQISNGKPIQVSEGHFLMRVKTPKGMAIKVCHEKKLKNIIVTEL